MSLKSNLPSSLQGVDPGIRMIDSSLIGVAAGMGNVNANPALTAGTTQTQAGGTKLFTGLNAVKTASGSDAVTMPSAASGSFLVLANHSGQTIQLFPAVGETINAASKDAAVTVATATTSVYMCSTAGQWWGGPITNEA